MLPAHCRHRTSAMRSSFVAAKPAQGRPRRFGSAVGCADCPAMLAILAWRATRYALTRCARTNALSQMLMRAVRAARPAALLGLPRTVFAAALAGFAACNPGTAFASGGTGQGRFVRRRGAQPQGRRAPARFVI
jgi:hypothetical protein